MRNNISSDKLNGDVRDPDEVLRQVDAFVERIRRKDQARRDNPLMTLGVTDIQRAARFIVRFGMNGRHLIADEDEVEAATRDGTMFQKFINNVQDNDAEAEIGAVLFDLFKIYRASRLRAKWTDLVETTSTRETTLDDSDFPGRAFDELRVGAFQATDRRMTVTEARRRVMAETGQSERAVIRETKGWTADEVLLLIA